MAKHPHKLALMDKKTWRCMLDGCGFFVHLGLAHILVGKQVICWKCKDTFALSTDAMEEDKPRCDNCRGGIDPDALEQYLKDKGIK